MNQKKRTMQTLVVGLILLVIGLVMGGAISSQLDVPARVFYESAGGGVLFPHNTHVENSSCADCHHELIGDVETSCMECHHDGSFDITEWEDEDNADLHQEMISEEDYSSCLDCHEHEAFILPVAAASKTGCAECHDECATNEFPPALMGHNCTACHAAENGDQVEACGSCHAVGDEEADATRRADALHNRCNRCHLELEKTTFMSRSRDDEATVCDTCHMK